MLCIILYLLSVLLATVTPILIIYSLAIIALAPLKIYLTIIHPYILLFIWYSYILYSLIALNWFYVKLKRLIGFILFTRKGRQILLEDIKEQFMSELLWLRKNRLSLIFIQIFIFIKNVIFIIFKGKRF